MPSIFELFPDIRPRSVLTPGGKPIDDEIFLSWRRAFGAGINARWLDRHTRFGEDLPDREPFDGAAFDEWLFRRLGGGRMFDDFNYSHRLRMLAVLFKTRRRQVVRLAHKYAARRIFLLEGRS